MRIFVALSAVLFSFAAFAAESVPASVAKTTFTQGKDYELIAERVRPVDASKIEVSEVFSYTCPHCMHFEPLISAWTKKQKADVSVVQIHTMWASQMEPYQRGFYTLVSLKMKDKLQQPVFDLIHTKHQELPNAQAWADFVATQGVDKKTFLDTYNSFSVTSQIKQADARTRGYKITGTPELVIDGQYRVNSTMAGGHEGMLNVAQYLVDKVRAERATK